MITRGCILLSVIGLVAGVTAAAAQEVPILYSITGGTGSDTGRAVATLGDLDGDGVRELVIGAPGGLPGGEPQFGNVRVVSGRSGVQLLTIDAQTLFPQNAHDASGLPLGALAHFGRGLAGVGDVTGDGVPDLAVGAPIGFPFSDAGQVGLYSGADGSLMIQALGSSLQDEFGAALARLPDLDGDGESELLVGAPGGDGLGYAAILSSVELEVLHLLQPGSLTKGARFGAAVTACGDLDDDLVPDFAVGAPDWGATFAGGPSQPGRVYVYSGADAELLVVLTGKHSFGRFGAALTGGFDLNGDGRGDLAVGAPGAAAGHGQVEVYSGRRAAAASGGLLEVLMSDSRDEIGYGTALASAGDVNGDGRDDLLVGVPHDLAGGADDATTSHVHLVSGADGADLALLVAPLPGWELGASLAHVGDVFGGGSNAFAFGAGGAAGQSGQVLVGFTPGPSSQESLPEPQNALAGRPGGPALLHLPLGGGSDISFGPLVVTPIADGDSVAASLFEPSDTAFVAFSEENVGEKPQEAESASLNHDAREDFVTANAGDDTFSAVLTADGATFADALELGTVIHVSTGINTNPGAIATGDLDGNGTDDVVVAGDLGISSFLNDGLGGFVLVDLLSKSVVTDVRLADVDGDTALDLVASSGALGGGGNVEVFLGDGDGTFTAAGSFAQGPPKVTVHLADFDADGDDDALVVAHFVQLAIPRARITVHLNDGAGTFADTPAWTLLVSNPGGLVPTYAAVADISRDGLLDVVLTHNDNAAVPPGTFAGVEPPLEITILLNQGAGGGGWQGFANGTLGTAYTGRGVEPILEDIFTDPGDPLATDPDLVLVWYVDEHAGQSPVPQITSFIGLLVGDGAGSFFDPDPNQFVLGDQPGDGDHGDVGVGIDPGVGAPGDGVPDLVFPNLLSNSLKVLLGDGEGGVAGLVTIEDVDELDPETLPPGLWSGGPRAARLAHLDDDGLLDAVVYNDWRDDFLGDVRASLSVFVSTGGGGFGKTQYLELPRAGELLLADVDLDGLCDVVVSQRVGPGTEDFLLVFAGLGDGTLDPTAEVVGVPGRRLTGGLAEGPIGGGPARAVFTTSQDHLTAQGQVLALVERTGHGLMTPRVSPMLTGWKSVDSLVAADLDLDGLTDLAVGSSAGRLVLAAGQGAGLFQERPINPSASAVGGGSIAVGRLDGDVFPDVISSKGNQAGQSGVHVLAGQPTGDFVASQIAGLSATGKLGAQRPLLIDLDDDGALDVVLSHGTGNAVSLLLSDLNAVEVVASGKAGSGGITPDLDAKGYTTPGSRLTLSLDEALGGADGWLLVGSAGGGGLPAIPPESIALVLPLAFGGTPGEAGGSEPMEFSFRLPSDPSAVGLQFVVQFLVADPGAAADPAGPAGLAASSALEVTLVD